MLTVTTNRNAALNAPGIDDLRSALERSLGAGFGDAWSDVCRASGVDPDSHSANDETLDRLIDGVAAYNPICRVVAMSWRIRRTAARKLSALGR